MPRACFGQLARNLLIPDTCRTELGLFKRFNAASLEAGTVRFAAQPFSV
jgi:hypothetical protein